MSNALETELRGLINELQGLYRQCSADIVKLKERKDYSERLEVLFVNIKNHLSKSMEVRHNQFRILMARIEQLEDLDNQIKEKLCSLEEKIKNITERDKITWDLAENNEKLIKTLESDNKLLNLVILEILKYAKFEDESKRNYIKNKLKELERNTEYYDERTLTHFISDIEDWMESHKFREDDSCAYWYIDVSNLEQYLIDRKKQMMKYNKEITKKQLESKK